MEPVILVVLLIGAIVFFVTSLRIAAEWERKVVLRLGRFAGARGPGVFLLVPFIETTPFTIDVRTVTFDFRAEAALTRDNVPVAVDASVFWRVVDAGRAAVQVADYRAAVANAAQAALRDILGRTPLAEVLSDRHRLDQEMTDILDAQTEPWGIKVSAVLIRDIRIPDALQDAMSRVAQAEREKQARTVLGESEVSIAARFAEAGAVYAANPMAMHLRGMNMLFETMKEKASVIVVPSSAVESMGFGGLMGMAALGRNQGLLPPATEGEAQPPGDSSPPRIDYRPS